MWDSMEHVPDAANPTEPDRPADRGDDPDDLAALERYASALTDAMVAALPGWVAAAVIDRLLAAAGSVTEAQRSLAVATGRAVGVDVEPPLRVLLATDVDLQVTTPLEIVRAHLGRPTEVLRSFGVPPAARDAFDAERFPDDTYDLAPRSYADLDPALADAALNWGAAKAHVHLRRRRGPG